MHPAASKCSPSTLACLPALPPTLTLCPPCHFSSAGGAQMLRKKYIVRTQFCYHGTEETELEVTSSLGAGGIVQAKAMSSSPDHLYVPQTSSSLTGASWPCYFAMTAHLSPQRPNRRNTDSATNFFRVGLWSSLNIEHVSLIFASQTCSNVGHSSLDADNSRSCLLLCRAE